LLVKNLKISDTLSTVHTIQRIYAYGPVVITAQNRICFIGFTTEVSFLDHMDISRIEATNVALNDSVFESGVISCDVYTYQLGGIL